MSQPVSRVSSRARSGSTLAQSRAESSSSAAGRVRAGRVAGASAAPPVAGAARAAAAAAPRRGALADKSNIEPVAHVQDGGFGKHLRASSHDSAPAALKQHKVPSSSAPLQHAADMRRPSRAAVKASSSIPEGLKASSSGSSLAGTKHARGASSGSTAGASRTRSAAGGPTDTMECDEAQPAVGRNVRAVPSSSRAVAGGRAVAASRSAVVAHGGMEVDASIPLPSASAPVISSTHHTAAAALKRDVADADEDMSDVESDWRSSGEGSSNEQSSKTDHGDAELEAGGHAAKRDADVDIVSDDAVSVADSDAASLYSLDPDFLVTLPPELEAAAQLRVREVCARYEEAVIRPNAARAAAERAELVSRGQLSADVAAHDDELALMGLDPEEVRDTSMVAEYSREIFAYMDRCERETMANPNYMSFQGEIEWHMRATLVDWLLQVHMRYHMLPETLWIAINIVDRFLSVRVVSLAKLQLVGVTAMFVAAKYEEILAPSVDEFVYMTESGYSRDEILKGERIILSTLDFNISSYCSPYSWVRRISKADDYDIQTRTLSKFLMEVTLLDSRFLRAKPSLIAAVGMFLSKKMLNGQWDDAFVYYSGFTEEQLVPGANLLLEKLLDDGFAEHFVCRKYANKKFLKASIFARDWAQRNHSALIAAAEAAAEQGASQ